MTLSKVVSFCRWTGASILGVQVSNTMVNGNVTDYMNQCNRVTLTPVTFIFSLMKENKTNKTHVTQ